MHPILKLSGVTAVAAVVVTAAFLLFPRDGESGEAHGPARARTALPMKEESFIPEGPGAPSSGGTARSEGDIRERPSTPSAAKARRDLVSAPYAATERAMLTGDSINEVAIEALQSKRFDRLVTQFEVEQAGMTGEITAAYRAELQRLLGSIDKPNQIDRLVCGTDLCIASIRSPSRDWFPAWYESMQEKSSLPMNALTGNSIDLGGSGVEYRLLFSISKDVKGFMGSAPRS